MDDEYSQAMHGFLRLMLATLCLAARLQGAAPQESMALYTAQCAACHGERGRGDGPAGRFLDPPPRNFRLGAFRFVSTTRGGPTDADLARTINHGLPGTAMLGYAHLGRKVVRDLVGVLRGFQRDGLRERLQADAGDADELAAWVAEDSRPGPLVHVPPEPADNLASRSRGRLLFQQSCAACHGSRGEGASLPDQHTVEGYPVRSRALTRGVLKAAASKRDLFVRIRAGLPGSPMPALPADALEAAGVWDLVHFLSSVIPDATALHTPLPARIPVLRVQRPLPSSADDPRFLRAPEIPVILAPMQAHAPGPSALSIRAVHDGELIVFRARWADPSWNGSGSPAPSPPDGFACRITGLRVPSVMPMPGLALPLDRGLWLAGPMPEREDPVFLHSMGRFYNPDEVCRSPLAPQRGGRGSWTSNVWTATLAIQPLKARGLRSGGSMPASFSVFEGSLRRGPMPVAFSHWQTLVFE